MNGPLTARRQATARDLYYFGHPDAWPLRPFLPVRRTRAGKEDQLGLLYDAKGASGTYGHNCTVYLVNLFELPPTEAEFLLLPRCVYDTFAELADAGWVVD